MTAVRIIVLGAFGIVLAVATVPWIYVAFGCEMAGESELGERVMNTSPIGLYWNWRDKR